MLIRNLEVREIIQFPVCIIPKTLQDSLESLKNLQSPFLNLQDSFLDSFKPFGTILECKDIIKKYFYFLPGKIKRMLLPGCVPSRLNTFQGTYLLCKFFFRVKSFLGFVSSRLCLYGLCPSRLWVFRVAPFWVVSLPPVTPQHL